MSTKIRAMFFSGTGTTEKITTFVAAAMQETLAAQEDGREYIKADDIDFTPKKARDEKYVFDEKDIVVFGTPVIAGRVPNVLLKFLDTLEGGGAIAIPIVLYGNRNFDDALIELRDILENKGFHTIAAAAFIGEHSFSKTLAAGRPDDKDMDIALGFARKAAEKVKVLLDASAENGMTMGEILKKTGSVHVKGNVPIRPYYQPRDRKGTHINILKVKPKLYADKCNKCGTCVTACPMGSIKSENPGVVDGICIKCCGCVKKCPQEALYFDDAGYLYHKEELEIEYAQRKEPELFL